MISIDRRPSTHLLLAGLLAACCISVGAEERTIYRTLDANGNPVFTDMPPRQGQSAEEIKITVTSGNSYASSAARTPYTGNSASSEAPTTGASYSLDIISPANDETIRDNAGSVSISAATTPALRRGHSLRLVMDGTLTDLPADGTVFDLSNVDRGTHTIAVAVVDRAGNVLAQGQPSTFHLQRYSVQSQAPRTNWQNNNAR
ncbi:MAG: DUF4124 domain-containing protein [Pseudomonadaceae bacterium]|nr:DUF4124 domain-containing protein [Pseudomonadaceae bacterium]